MAISGDFRVSAALNPYKFNPIRTSTQFPPNKVDFNAFISGTPGISRSSALDSHTTFCCNSKRQLGLCGDYKLSRNPINPEVESFLLNAIKMNFFERLNLAWKIIFPSPPSRKNSNARIAKQRLKMILFSDRCAVSDEAKQKIVSSIVTVLSDFVEIESQDKVQLSVSTDAVVGTIYSVTVPIQRVRSEHQIDGETGSIRNVEGKQVQVLVLLMSRSISMCLVTSSTIEGVKTCDT